MQPVYDDTSPQARMACENFGHNEGSNLQNWLFHIQILPEPFYNLEQTLNGGALSWDGVSGKKIRSEFS